MEIRSFLAFELPPEIKSAVAQVSDSLRKSALDVRWVKVENIHLTIVFMGNTNTDHIHAIGHDIKKICSQYGSFDISIKGMGCFPNSRRPRVLWVGLDGDLERMAQFRDDLQDQLKPFGIKVEKRKFKPHLTLGRFRSSRKTDSRLDEALTSHGVLNSPFFPLNELILFKSDLKPSGAVYTKLEAWPLLGVK